MAPWMAPMDVLGPRPALNTGSTCRWSKTSRFTDFCCVSRYARILFLFFAMHFVFLGRDTDKKWFESSVTDIAPDGNSSSIKVCTSLQQGTHDTHADMFALGEGWSVHLGAKLDRSEKTPSFPSPNTVVGCRHPYFAGDRFVANAATPTSFFFCRSFLFG